MKTEHGISSPLIMQVEHNFLIGDIITTVGDLMYRLMRI